MCANSLSIFKKLIPIAEQREELKDLIHDLDVWHKSAKLVKALTDVSNGFAYLFSQQH